VIGESDDRRMSMTSFGDDAGERRERGRIERRGHRMRALIYGKCLYDAIRVGEELPLFFFIVIGGTCFIL
jgi:hypothetical protein